jgi:hypothetical protein
VPQALAVTPRHRSRRRHSGGTTLAALPPLLPSLEEPEEYVRLEAPEGGAEIHLFGVIHGGNESEVAEFIMRERPELVVVETALNTAHGSAHGNVICRQDCLTFAHAAAPGSHEQRARLFAQYGVQLADMAHPLGSHLWHDLSQGSHALYNEQLVYVAAFAVGACLVFGDRPKQITYSRMLWMPSIGALGCCCAAVSAAVLLGVCLHAGHAVWFVPATNPQTTRQPHHTAPSMPPSPHTPSSPLPLSRQLTWMRHMAP